MADLAILVEIRDLLREILEAQHALIDALAADQDAGESGERDQTEPL